MKKTAKVKIDDNLFKKSSKKRKIVGVLLAVFVLLPLLTLGICAAGFAIWSANQQVDVTLLPSKSAVPVFYDRFGNRLDVGEDDYVTGDEAPKRLKDAFVAIEDKRFYEHKGYDVVRIGGAILSNIKAGKVSEGASTITQQLVKNTLLTPERTLSRKLKEIALAAKLEKMYTKDEILSMYLSVIYFGNGAYGVKAAARRFFDKQPDELTLSECATLAGLVKNPAGYSPLKRPESAEKRRNTVLSVMKKEGYISDEEYAQAINEPIKAQKYYKTGDSLGLDLYVAKARQEVCDKLNITPYQLDNSGYKIYLNVDCEVQKELERQRKDGDNFQNDDIDNLSVVLDNATGGVLGLSSSLGYEASRQAGSVLKPLAVYAPALDMRLVTLATPVVDEKVNYGGYSPSNFADVYYGQTTVREGIKKSMNSVSVKVLDYLGLDACMSYLNRFGIPASEGDANYAIALGATSKGCLPTKIAAAYSALARGGVYTEAKYVRGVTKGDEIVMSDAFETSVAVGKAAAYLTTLALEDTVRDGTAKALNSVGIQLAAKTGTAQAANGNNSDAWIASYNPDYTVLVWHGSDDGMDEKGGGHPARQASKIWSWITSGMSVSPCFEPCGEVVGMDVDVYSTKRGKGVVAASENTPMQYRKTEYFDINNLPSQAGSIFDRVPPCELSVCASGGKAVLSFETEEVFSYEVYRTDILGRAKIYSGQGSNAPVVLEDRPITLGGKAEYELVCVLDRGRLQASCKRTVFLPHF